MLLKLSFDFGEFSVSSSTDVAVKIEQRRVKSTENDASGGEKWFALLDLSFVQMDLLVTLVVTLKFATGSRFFSHELGSNCSEIVLLLSNRSDAICKSFVKILCAE